MDYELIGYFPADLVHDIWWAAAGRRVVDHLRRRDADRRGGAIVKKRARNRSPYVEIALQAAIGTRIIARETISP